MTREHIWVCSNTGKICVKKQNINKWFRYNKFQNLILYSSQTSILKEDYIRCISSRWTCNCSMEDGVRDTNCMQHLYDTIYVPLVNFYMSCPHQSENLFTDQVSSNYFDKYIILVKYTHFKSKYIAIMMLH